LLFKLSNYSKITGAIAISVLFYKEFKLMAKDFNHMPSLLDREIESPEKDAFGHRHFANALESLIETPENSPPFSIGLLGGWGTGKSTIKAIYLRKLKDVINRSKKIHPIIFNAWRFGGENIKRALLRHVFLEIDGDESSLKDALYRHIQKLLPEKKTWRQIFRSGAEEWGWCLLNFFLIALIALLFIKGISWKYDLSNNWALAAIVFGMFFAGGEIIKYNLQRLSSFRSPTVTQIEPPFSTIEEYEDLLLTQLKNYKFGKTSSKKGKSCERLVIFVDDLDRLSREEMVNGLDAIRTFMEIPKEKLPDGLGIVFVVSCDEERIAAALARSRQSDMPGAVFTRNDARRFLDRIFQFRLEIPSFPKRDMRNYATKKLNEDLKEIFDDLKQREVSIETLIDRMIHVGVQTPRNALQILNAFAQCWWLASKREFDGAGTEVPGGLQEGAVTSHPYALAALCAIRVDFPDFYEHLQREPELIKRFTNVFIRGEALKDQPESALDILKKYVDDKNNLKPEHNSLRQFISGLQGLHWPPSLQPLLLLTQDPVTRKFGDKGPRLYNALVSGDDFSVLVELGRDKDSKPLTIDEVRLLHDMVEDLHHETSVYRDNAAAAIAALSKRLPYDQAHILLSSIAQRLSVSPELRWRLGVKKISDILPHALSENRKEVAEKLINDLLKIEGDINFKLESGEQPSLDEALEMAHRACSLALSVREQDGLDEKPDAILLSWLGTRRVSVNKKEDHLPFSDLEGWMDKYETQVSHP
jgi:hypothetical protein